MCLYDANSVNRKYVINPLIFLRYESGDHATWVQ